MQLDAWKHSHHPRPDLTLRTLSAYASAEYFRQAKSLRFEPLGNGPSCDESHAIASDTSSTMIPPRSSRIFGLDYWFLREARKCSRHQMVQRRAGTTFLRGARRLPERQTTYLSLPGKSIITSTISRSPRGFEPMATGETKSLDNEDFSEC